MRRSIPYWAGLAGAALVLALVIWRLAVLPKADARPTPALCLHDGKLYSDGAFRRDGDRCWECAGGQWVPTTPR